LTFIGWTIVEGIAGNMMTVVRNDGDKIYNVKNEYNNIIKRG
jgi:uncharacterized membrane protein